MAKKAAPKSTPKAAPAPKKAADSKAKYASKGEIFTKVADKTKLTKKQVSDVFDAMTDMIKSELSNRKGSQTFVLPGLLKISVQRKEATKAKEGKNPFTGEPMTIKAKPARNVIKARPLKALRDMV